MWRNVLILVLMALFFSSCTAKKEPEKKQKIFKVIPKQSHSFYY